MAKVLPGEFYIQDAGIKYLNFIEKGKLSVNKIFLPIYAFKSIF